MRLKAIQFYRGGTYHLYDDLYHYCPFLVKRGTKDGFKYDIKSINDKTVCKYCSTNYKAMAFKGFVKVPPLNLF